QILVKDRSGLTGIGIDEVDRDLAELCVGNRLDFVNGFLVRFLLGRRSSGAFVASVLRRCRRCLRLASLFISRRPSGCLVVVITTARGFRCRSNYISSVICLRCFPRNFGLSLIPICGGGVNPRVCLTHVFALITSITR